MADKWIVTDKEYVKHDTLGAAEHERDRLCGTIPKRKFRVLRIKTNVAASNGFDELRSLLNEARPMLNSVAPELCARITETLRRLSPKLSEENNAAGR